MENKRLYELKEVISSVNGKGNNKFKLALLLNEKMIDERIESLEKLREQSEEYKAFEQKRRELILEYAELDKNNQVVVYTQPEGKGEKSKDGFGYPNIIKDKEEYEKKINLLQKENKEVIDSEVKKQNDFMEILNEPVEPSISFNVVPFDSVPEIEYHEMRVLLPLIEVNG